MVIKLLEKLGRVCSLLIRDPGLFAIKLQAWFKTLFAAKTGTIPLRMGQVIFQCELDLDPNVRRMLMGDYEPEIARVFRQLLRDGDVMVDAGANIGYFSAMALSLVGIRGQVHAFEPVPAIFERLVRLRRDNPAFAFRPNEIALGERKEDLPLAVTKQKNIGWNTMVPGLMEADDIGATANVQVERLDEYLALHRIEMLKLVKIDTEGFEFPVLKGFAEFLRETRNPPSIIVELAAAAYARLGTNLDEFDGWLRQYQYVPRDLRNQRTLSLQSLTGTTNLLLVPRRDLSCVT